MAARKAKAAAKKRKFAVLCTSCGEDSQLELYGDMTFPTMAQAKAYIDDVDRDDEGSGCKFYIVEFVATGTVKFEFNWE